MCIRDSLDKCIGCHTCSVTCKQTWTNRSGVEYVWFNNVETRPGLGYPRRYEDQEQWKGGWVRTKRGKLRLKSGGRLHRLSQIFSNPKLPGLDDYYEPWTYDYDTLISSPTMDTTPVARPKSMITGKDMEIRWGANWDDDLGGTHERGHQDPMLKGIEDSVVFELEKAFMFYLPRICEHCLNPSCVASCPSGAMYKREEDGIVLVDQSRCRGYQECNSACPYKKVMYNPEDRVSQKCIACYPRLEAGVAPACVRQCPGRVRHIDYMDNKEGHPHKLVNEWKVALPLRPDFGTEPNVFYVPPLAPSAFNEGGEFDDTKRRIPAEYLRERFGPGVDAALETIEREREKTTRGESSELMDILISRDWNDLMGPFTQNPAELIRPPVTR